MVAPAPSIDLYYRSILHRGRNMDSSSPKRASIDRQTGLAQLHLVSKYYGYPNSSHSPSYPIVPQDASRRPDHSYGDQHRNQRSGEADGISYHMSPSRRPELAIRTQERGSIGSADSPPSLIDDRTDSELSHDDDYQYHAATSPIWDTFLVSPTDSACFPPHEQEKCQLQYDQQHHHHKLSLNQKHHESSVSRPGLVPSPHITRAKKPSAINYDDSPRPPKPAGYALGLPPPVPPKPPAKDVAGWPLPSHETHEMRRTVRAVKSSYHLFPKQTIRPSPSAEVLSPPPRTSSLPRVVTPTLSGPSWTFSSRRKTSQPEPPHHRHHNSEQVAPIITSDFGVSPPAAPRPHTSHGPSAASQSPDTTASPHFACRQSSATAASAHLSDPTDVTTTIPLFPSTNLVDLVNPRSAPAPPDPSSSAPSTPVLTTQKSFFDFDSDSESEGEGRGRFSRLVRGRRHKQSQSTTDVTRQQPSPTKASRKSVDRPRSRPHVHTTTTTTSTTTAATVARSSHEAHEGLRRVPSPEESQGRKRRWKEGRKSDVLGRMFGRSGRGG